MTKNITVYFALTVYLFFALAYPSSALELSFDKQHLYYKNNTYNTTLARKDSFTLGTKGKLILKSYPLDVAFALQANRSTSGNEIKDNLYLKISDHSLDSISIYLGGNVMKIKKHASNQDYHAFLGAYYTYKENKKNFFKAGAHFSFTQFHHLHKYDFENTIGGFEPYLSFFIRPKILKGHLKFDSSILFQWLEKSYFNTFKSSQVSLEQRFSYKEGPWEMCISFWSALNERVSFPSFNQGFDIDHYGDGYTGIISTTIQYALDKNASLSLSYSISEFYELTVNANTQGVFSDKTTTKNSAKLGYSFHF